MLEAGLPIKQLRDKLRDHGVMLSDIGACLCSHSHGDHSKAVKDLLKMGIDCHMSYGTAKALNVVTHHRSHMWDTYLEPLSIPFGWVTAFPLEHDAPDPIGFYISYDKERLLFIPDTAYVENRFQGVTILVIECNNAEDILSEKIFSGATPSFIGKRIRRNHFSLANVKEFILANNMAKTLWEIWLIHLSDTNSSEQRFKKEIQEITGVPVYVT